jgi:hypothetical protein
MAAHGMDFSAVATPSALKQLQPTAGTLNVAGVCRCTAVGLYMHATVW